MRCTGGVSPELRKKATTPPSSATSLSSCLICAQGIGHPSVGLLPLPFAHNTTSQELAQPVATTVSIVHKSICPIRATPCAERKREWSTRRQRSTVPTTVAIVDWGGEVWTEREIRMEGIGGRKRVMWTLIWN